MSTSHIKSNLVNMQDTESVRNGNSNGHTYDNGDLKDEVDEGLAALKRRPSIRDRKKVCISLTQISLFVVLNKDKLYIYLQLLLCTAF